MLTPCWRYCESTVWCVVIVFPWEKRFESVEGGVSDDILMDGDGVQLTAQSDCLNQGMCDKDLGRGLEDGGVK